MIDFSYSLKQETKYNLENIEKSRRKIILTPISTKNEIRLRWEATLNRIYAFLSLLESDISRNDMGKLLISPNQKSLSKQEKEVINYRKALNYIAQNWLVSSKSVSINTILHLHQIACQPIEGKSSSIFSRNGEKSLKSLLDYLQSGAENPIIQAGIAQIRIIQTKPFVYGNRKISTLLPLLFLYKYGYDFRGLLVLPEQWKPNTISLQSPYLNNNLTNWLEFFTQRIALQLEKVLKEIESMTFQTNIPASWWELNERQKDILTFLEHPGGTITNRMAQKLFKISQITASRDLAKLNALGLIFPHGRGRSIRYMKI